MLLEGAIAALGKVGLMLNVRQERPGRRAGGCCRRCRSPPSPPSATTSGWRSTPSSTSRTVRVIIPRLKEAGRAGHRGVPAEQDRDVAAAMAGRHTAPSWSRRSREWGTSSRSASSGPRPTASRPGSGSSSRFPSPRPGRTLGAPLFALRFADRALAGVHHAAARAPTSRTRWTRSRWAAPVQLEGPFGAFVMPPDVERAAFLAGGIGITCVRSILRWVCDTCAPEATRRRRVGRAGGPQPVASARSCSSSPTTPRMPSRSTRSSTEFTRQLSRASGWCTCSASRGRAWQGYRGHLDQDVLGAGAGRTGRAGTSS